MESFLCENWEKTAFGGRYDIYSEGEGEKAVSGKQYQTDSGTIDILAVSKDRKEFLVVELKKGRAGDRVLGQVQRYMGHVQNEMCENGETVKGAIVAFSEDPKLKTALSVANNVDLYGYEIDFKLEKK